MDAYFKNKRVAVTGAAGTVGSELVRQLLAGGAEEVCALDHSETALWSLEAHHDCPQLTCLLADVQNLEHLRNFFEGIDYVFHVAAYKHVPLCEKHPRAAVETNIIGVQNVITAARDNGVDRVLFTSSDKAVNPTNVMGTTKLMGERLITAANTMGSKGRRTIFASTRFGNVAGSSGSVIPIFQNQIKNGRPITLTDAKMTRFMMTLEESVRLVIESLRIAVGGEVFVTKMPVIRIVDLAEVMRDELAPAYGRTPQSIEIRITGSRPGEKLYEELTTDEEIKRTVETTAMFVVLPAWRDLYSDIDFSKYAVEGTPITKVYNSDLEPAISRAEVATFLKELGVKAS
jgi:FlaA1/EpsC-like NDP-sugar epimerase